MPIAAIFLTDYCTALVLIPHLSCSVCSLVWFVLLDSNIVNYFSLRNHASCTTGHSVSLFVWFRKACLSTCCAKFALLDLGYCFLTSSHVNFPVLFKRFILYTFPEFQDSLTVLLIVLSLFCCLAEHEFIRSVIYSSPKRTKKSVVYLRRQYSSATYF